MNDDNPYMERDCESGQGVPKEKEKEGSNAPNAKTESTDTPSPVVVTKSDQPPTKSGQCKKRYECIKKEVKYYVEVLGIIGGLFGIYVLAYQLWGMNAQTAVFRGQLKEMQVDRNLDERAWIYAELRDNSLNNSPNNWSVILYIRNAGKTPGIVLGNYVGFTCDTNQILNSDPRVRGIHVSINPGVDTHTQFSMGSLYVEAMQHNVPVYFFGTVYYRDIFTSNHWTQFNYILTDGGKNMVAAGFHEACDDTASN